MEQLILSNIASMNHDEFVAALGDLFEHSPWVAEAAWAHRPFASEAGLHDAMMRAVTSAPIEHQIVFLRQHPELAGKEAQAGTMTGHSTFEQGTGLASLTHTELLELQRLNAAYAERHGFPFIIAVLGHTKPQIFDALRTRLANQTVDEIGEALRQISKITRRRLHQRFGIE
jgi:2-oxo-4-hydroxy-4-carboxy-5-ureidoimidazoline decarboxylase